MLYMRSPVSLGGGTCILAWYTLAVTWTHHLLSRLRGGGSRWLRAYSYMPPPLPLPLPTTPVQYTPHHYPAQVCTMYHVLAHCHVLSPLHPSPMWYRCASE